MDRHAKQAVRSGARVGARRGIALAALLLTLASGCVEHRARWCRTSSPRRGHADRRRLGQSGADRAWTRAHNGAPMYGLAGRVFLFGPG